MGLIIKDVYYIYTYKIIVKLQLRHKSTLLYKQFVNLNLQFEVKFIEIFSY